MAFRDFLRNPFSFLFSRSPRDDRLTVYVVREHERGRSLADILDDPYIRNRCSNEERARLLERPEIIRAIGQSSIEDARETLASIGSRDR